ncbi:DUF7524 family protein [Halomicrococcus gelatinilyticus]|uniref:DUF7524 family protein n=1 Tax=Halomicrococcus gelatinilyticus TaxID=1702103 RepID=UPI002E0F1C04
MSGILPITLNRDGLHDVAVTGSFEADGSFSVTLENDGAPVHVHLHLDDDLSTVATLQATNHYVEAGATRAVAVEVDGDLPASGRLKVVTGYGAETAYVDVSIAEPDDRRESIPVDEGLGSPSRQATATNEESTGRAVDLAVVALGVVALALAGSASLLVDGLAAVFGALVVLAGVGTAAYLLVS